MMEKPTVEAPVRSKKKTKGRKVLNLTSKKQYMYDRTNEGLPIYGVIVQWDTKQKLSNRYLTAFFESKLKDFKCSSENYNNESKELKSLQHKKCPFFRRVGPGKGMIMFDDMNQANKFAAIKDAEFDVFIPMSFISTVGVALFNKVNFKSNEIQQFLPAGYEALHWRKKRLENKIQLTIAVRGTKIPENLDFRGDSIPFELYERKPVYCTRCIRYGHRTSNCLRKPRCSACVENTPLSKHREKDCKQIKLNRSKQQCMYCGQSHTIGYEECTEHVQQCEYKMKLVKHKMNYLSVIEKDILPAIRTTAINSNRIWLD